MTAPAATSTEDRALQLLGSGIPAEQVASALGVDASRISQLLSDKTFADQVALLRYNSLQKHNTRDAAYDSIEDKLVVKLDKAMGLMFKPETILKAIQVINGAKRRGQSAPDQVTNQQNIVTLVLPAQITQKFITNINNQVVTAGAQDLATMQSGSLLALAEKKEAARELAHHAQEDSEIQPETI